MDKRLSCIVVLLLISISIGCTEEQSKDTDYLDDVALTVDDLDRFYELVDENYVTEPYSSDDSKLFSGWNVSQKYSALFFKNDTNFIQHEIVKLPSNEKTVEFQNMLINNVDDLGYDFIRVDIEDIGNITLLFQADTLINNINTIIYLLTFNYQDLVVIIQTANNPKNTISEYGSIVYNNILKVRENGA